MDGIWPSCQGGCFATSVGSAAAPDMRPSRVNLHALRGLHRVGRLRRGARSPQGRNDEPFYGREIQFVQPSAARERPTYELSGPSMSHVFSRMGLLPGVHRARLTGVAGQSALQGGWSHPLGASQTMRMKHHGLGLPDRPNTRLFGRAAPELPVAVRESPALGLPIISVQQPVNDGGEDQ